MKIKNTILSVGLSAAIVLMGAGCSSMSNTAKGGVIGGTAGAAVGAGVGALVSKNKTKGALIGAAAGAAVGTTAGVLIGKKMDKKKAELAALENATVEDATDVNGLQAIKVTFDSGILFATNSSTLNASAKSELKTFASKLNGDMTDTNVSIFGHTDNTGSDSVNQPLSEKRGNAVADVLKANGVSSSRITVTGMSSSDPIADNSTAEGRKQNRRVEVYISANQDMIDAAEAGTLK